MTNPENINGDLIQKVMLINADTGQYIQRIKIIDENGNAIYYKFDRLEVGSEDNYVQINENGELQLIGDSSQWDDLSIELNRGKQGQIDKPDYDFTNLGLLFPQNSTSEIVYAIVQMKHQKKMDTMIYPHIHYIQSSANKPIFDLQYKFYNNGELVPASFTTVKTNDVGGNQGVFTYTSGNLLQIASFPPIAAPTNETVSANFEFKLFRNDNVVSGDVLAKYFDLHYEIDTFGSNEQYEK